MHVIIGGCGRVGAELADRLSREEHDVVVVDTSIDAFDRIGSAFNGETLTGDITDKDVLQRAGISNADALAAVTDLDNANLMSVEIARELFDVPITVARLFNPLREESYRKMGVSYVSGTRLLAKAIMRELRVQQFPLHVSFGDSDVEIVEMRVTDRGSGLTVNELQNRGRLRIAAIERGLRVRIPAGEDRLEAGDLIVAAVRGRPARKARDLVTNPLQRPPVP